MTMSTSKRLIFVGVDGSWRESGALTWALQEAELRHQPLSAIHVKIGRASCRERV